LNEKLKNLLDLQNIDSSILNLVDRVETLHHKLKEPKASLKDAKSSYEKIKSKYDDLNKKKKAKELELEDIQDKIDKMKSRSGEIKTNKEYDAHLKEIETFEGNKDKVEEEMLYIMEDMDSMKDGLKDEEVKIKEAEEEVKKHEKILKDEEDKLKAEIESHKRERKEISGRIDEETYTQYMSTLKKLGGLAVVPADKEVCLGCNTNIPPQLYNDIKKNDKVIKCYYCKRFLYFKEN